MAPSIMVNPTTFPSGTHVTITGSGFTPTALIYVQLGAYYPNQTSATIQTLTGTNKTDTDAVVADGAGGISASVRVSYGSGAALPSGPYFIYGYEPVSKIQSPPVNVCVDFCDFPVYFYLGEAGKQAFVTGKGTIMANGTTCMDGTNCIPYPGEYGGAQPLFFILEQGSSHTFTATPATGCKFVNFQDGAKNILSTTSPFTLTIPQGTFSQGRYNYSVAAWFDFVEAIANKAVTTTIIVTGGFPIPSVSLQLFVDGNPVGSPLVTPSEQVTIGQPIQNTMSIPIGHQIYVVMHLENAIGFFDITSATVQT